MPEHTPAPTPSRAVYGFALYLSFRIFFIIYLIWAIIPHSWFEYFNIFCFPQRYWAVAIPISIITAILIFGIFIYPSINLCMTPDFNDLSTVRDETIEQRSNYKSPSSDQYEISDCMCTDKAKCGKQEYTTIFKDFHFKCVPSAEDLDITHVSKTFYSKLKSS